MIKYLIINAQRSFAVQKGVPTVVRFVTQVETIHWAVKDNPDLIPVVVSDFNLDYKLINNSQYHLQNLFDLLNETMDEGNMIQIINFTTWSHRINGIKRESILDHVYIQDNIQNFYSIIPKIGDHKIIIIQANGSLPIPTKQMKCNLRKYTLSSNLSGCNFEYNINNV